MRPFQGAVIHRHLKFSKKKKKFLTNLTHLHVDHTPFSKIKCHAYKWISSVGEKEEEEEYRKQKDRVGIMGGKVVNSYKRRGSQPSYLGHNAPYKRNRNMCKHVQWTK